MAVFNPDVPDVQPRDYTSLSKPISDMTADKSKGMLLAASGEALTGTVDLIDRTEKDYLKDKITTDVQALQSNYITGLKDARSAQITGVIPGQDGDATLANNEPAVPAGVQQGVQRATQLAEARLQNGGTGKANDTLYAGALYSYMKQLRSENPGYRDYIDQEVAKVSGKDPANYFMQNILQDINASATNTKSEAEKAIALGRQYLGADKSIPMYIEAVRRGLPGAVQNLESHVNTVAAQDWQFKEWQRQRAVGTASKEDDAILAKDQYGQEVFAKGYNLFNTVLKVPGLTNPATIQKMLDDDRNGIAALQPEQWTQLLGAATAARDAAYREATNIANGRGYSSRIGDPKAEQAIRESKLQVFDQMVEAIKNKEVGTLFGAQRRVQAMLDGTEDKVLGNEDIGPSTRLTAAMTKFAGPNWVNMEQARQLQSGVGSKWKSFAEDVTRRAQLPDDLRQDGKVKSMYADIVSAQKANVPVASKVYDSVVDNVRTIAMDQPPKGTTQEQMQAVKKEVVDYAFSPKNWKLMDRFQKDFTDSDGKFHKGKYSVFDTMTQPKITDNIWNLNDRQSWDKYKNWGEQSFNRLFGEEVNDMNKIQTQGALKVGVTWDSDNKRFDLTLPKPTTNIEANTLKSYSETVNRLNSGLYNLSRIKDKEGTDTSAYLLQQLQIAGFRPGEGTQGLPQAMMDAVAASKKTNRIEDAFSAARGGR